MKMVISLLEGFNKDQVTVKVNERLIFSGEVTTRNQIGLAWRKELDMQELNAQLKVELINRHLSKTMNINLSKDQYIGLSIDKGDLHSVTKDNPFHFA